MTSDSGFIVPEQFSHEWQNICLVQKRRDNIIYTGERYGRRFLLKGLQPECAALTEYRLQQEKEFRLGIALSHPNIAATFSLEEVPGIGHCIVQEWIDGQTLSEWIQTKPSLRERQRVWEQLMSALAYLHENQRVHHDLKSSNILVTRNGQNIKLIDFGLSDSDDSTCSVKQDAGDDIRNLAPLLQIMFPHRYRLMVKRCLNGGYTNISALQRAWRNRLQIRRFIPISIAVVLLAAASVLFGLAYHERHAEQQKHQQMMVQVDEAVARYAEELNIAVQNTATWPEAMEKITQMSEKGWSIRDSIISLYPETDPICIEIFDLWTQRMSKVHNEAIKSASAKPNQ